MSALLASAVIILATLLAGAAGAVLRGWAVAHRPIGGTHAVNLVGTVLLAVALVARERGLIGDAAAVIVGIGFCGALTTFSGWMQLIDRTLRDAPWRALIRDVSAPVFLAITATVLVFAMFSG